MTNLFLALTGKSTLALFGCRHVYHEACLSEGDLQVSRVSSCFITVTCFILQLFAYGENLD